MERELRSYRANPTDFTFARLYNVAYPWLKNVGISTVRKYNSLSISGTLDDVLNEGALALSVSTRRFVFMCPDCPTAFVDEIDLVRHAMREHRRRGSTGLVSLAQFARTSARLAMRRTARRMYRPEIPTADLERDVVDLDVEDRIVLELTIARFRDRLSARARANLELVLRRSIGSSSYEDLRLEADRLICVMRRRTSRRIAMTDSIEPKPEPNWAALNIRTLRESARDVLGIESERRTMKTAYAEIYERLRETDRELVYTCQNCNSLIDDQMERCWACGLVFRDDDAQEEKVVDVEVVERARKLGIDVEGKDRDELVKAIEDLEMKTREARRSVDLLVLESKQLNDAVTAAMPDGWSKKVSKQYTAYFDADRTRRLGIFHRGLRVQFSVDEGFLDGFPDLTYYSPDDRRAKHYGRVNYEYQGDTSKFALDLCQRVMKRYGSWGK
jgi:hypothetical protein